MIAVMGPMSLPSIAEVEAEGDFALHTVGLGHIVDKNLLVWCLDYVALRMYVKAGCNGDGKTVEGMLLRASEATTNSCMHIEAEFRMSNVGR